MNLHIRCHTAYKRKSAMCFFPPLHSYHVYNRADYLLHFII